MAYTQNITDLPVGSIGLVQRDNRLQHLPGELIVASGLTFEDGSLRKETGAIPFDPVGVAGTPSEAVTLVSNIWGADLSAFTGSGIAVGGTATFAVKGPTGTSVSVTVPAGGYAVGSFVVVAVTTVANPSQQPNNVSDSTGTNQYTANPVVDIVVGSVKLFFSKLIAVLNAGATIDVTWSAAFPGTVTVANFTGVDGTLDKRASKVSVGSGGTVGPTASISSVPYLAVTALGSNGNAQFVPGSSFIEAFEVFSANSGDSALHYRIDTAPSTIVALYEWASDIQTTPAGTLTTTSGSAAVIGVGTTFTNHAPGDKIIVANEVRTIATITDGTHLTTTDPWTGTNAPGTAYDRRVGNRLITATLGGAIYKDKPDSLTTTNLDATTLSSTLSKVARPGRFVAAGKEAAASNRKLFYFNGVDRPQVLSGDGATTTNLATPTADWGTATSPLKQPSNGTVHTTGLSARLVGWGNVNRPHTVYFSDPDNHEDFTSAASFQLSFASHLGERIICGVDYQGVLILWKYPRGIFYLDDSDLTPANWSIRTKSEALGCALSPYAVLAIDEDILFMAADGQFHMLSAVDTFGGLRTSNLSHALGFSNWLTDNVNLARLDQATSLWYPEKRIALFGVPGVGKATNTLTLKFDFSGTGSGKPVLFSTTDRDSPDAFALKRFPDSVSRPIFGDSGFVWLTEQAARNKDGNPYTGTFQTAHEDYKFLDPKLRYKRKLWEHLELVMEPVSAGTITVVASVDGAARQTLTFDATKRRQRKKLNVGDGYTFSVSATESTLNGDMNVIGISVWFTVGDEDQSR